MLDRFTPRGGHPMRAFQLQECNERMHTYPQLVARADGLAEHLRRVRVRWGDLVAVAPRVVDAVSMRLDPA